MVLLYAVSTLSPFHLHLSRAVHHGGMQLIDDERRIMCLRRSPDAYLILMPYSTGCKKMDRNDITVSCDPQTAPVSSPKRAHPQPLFSLALFDLPSFFNHPAAHQPR